MTHEISPCFWFDNEGKEAAAFYCSLFPDAKIIADIGIMVIFKLAGQRFLALNGGPMFKKNNSISLYTML
jgi:predicted 3-demethylubiquinone-9 3-methyltransferase (glyoxalase superfamily)